MRKNIISSRAGAKQRPANTSNTLAECDSTQRQPVEAPQSGALASVAGSGNTPNSAAPPSAPQPDPVHACAGEPNIGETKPTGGTGTEPNPAAPKSKVTTKLARAKELSPEQQKRKADLEKVIEGGLKTWIEVCCAMAEIKASGLYHPYDTFHEYCRERFKFARSTSYAYANAGHAFQLIESSGEDCLPRNEAQLRPLLDLEDDQVTKVWSDAVILGGTGGLTESIVRKARERLIGKPVQNIDPIKQTHTLKKSIRGAFDKYPAEERPNLIYELTSFTSALGEELKGEGQQLPNGEDLKEQCHVSDAKKIEAVAPQEIPAIKAGTKTIPQVLKEIAPKPQPVEFNAELRWADVEAYLKHERESWPVEHLGYLSTHLATLLMSWEPADEDSQTAAPIEEPKDTGPVKDISQAVVGSIVTKNDLNHHYDIDNYPYQAYGIWDNFPCLEKWESEDYATTWGDYDTYFKVISPLPSKQEFGPICEAWLKKYDEERAAKVAAEAARVAEEERRETAAFVAETPGTPMHKLRRDVEDAKAKLAEAKAKAQSVYDEHALLRKAEAAAEEAKRANPNTKPKSKAQAKSDEKAKQPILKARADIRSKAYDDEYKAEQELDDARNAVVAFEVSEVAKTCKKGKDLPMAQVGETVVIQDIKKFYKDNCFLILEGYLADKEGNTEGLANIDETESPAYSLLRALKPLPTMAVFKNLKAQTFTKPLSNVVHLAYEMIEHKKSEWQCTQEEAGDAAQEGEAYAERQEKIDALEEVSEPDVPESIDAITIYCEPMRGGLAAAERILECCLQAINEDGGQHSTPAEAEALTKAIEETISTLDNL